MYQICQILFAYANEMLIFFIVSLDALKNAIALVKWINEFAFYYNIP